MALNLAQEKLEEIIEGKRASLIWLKRTTPQRKGSPPSLFFSRSVSIDSLGPGLKQIKVVVEKGGKRLSLVTLAWATAPLSFLWP